jgi:hypothetical protein
MTLHQAARRTCVAAIAAVLTGCATVPSTRLKADIAPLREVWVVVYANKLGFASLPPPQRGPGSDYAKLLAVELPRALDAKGLRVSGLLQVERPINELAQLEALWNAHPEAHPRSSHVLVLTAQNLVTTGSSDAGLQTQVQYEAVLWEPATRTLAWKAAPRSPFYSTAKLQPKEIEVLADNVTRAMRADGLIAR